MRVLSFFAALLLALPAAAADLPDPALTPGAVNPELTTDVICAPGFTTRAYRHTTQTLKLAVYRAYGIAPHEGYCSGPEGCEVDHLISLELGGADVQANLWPQPYSGSPWNAHVKDKLENALHRMVCAGQISLDEAQHAISADWIAAYGKYVGGAEPVPVSNQ